MADIDKARTVAKLIKSDEIKYHPYYAENFVEAIKALADGFLALDKLLETHPPSEKPQKYLSVLIKMKGDGNYHIWYQVGCWDRDEVWTVCDLTYKSDDIEHWQHLPTADKR